MKKLLISLSLLAFSTGASANNFFGSNNGEWKMGPYGPYYEENSWPEWTPMYWMQEMVDSFDNNDDGYGNNGFIGGMPFMGNNNTYPMMAPPVGVPMGVPMMPPTVGMAPMGAPMMAPAVGVPPMGAPTMAAPMTPMPMPPAPPMPVTPGATPGPAAK